jgi:LCP family protein required for cell wall assembly
MEPEENGAKSARMSSTKKRMQKRLRTTLLALLLAVALLATGVFVYIYYQADKTKKDEGYHYVDEASTHPEEEEVTGLEVGHENVDASSLDEYLRLWSANGMKPLHDKNVVNVLFCGVDSTDGRALAGRSDAIMLISVNKKQKSITLTSFYRDSYTYIDLTKNTKNPRTIMDKVNSAYSLGGPATLVETLEANYKIKIDSYISVDFKTFPKLINSFGGVAVDVTAREASFINRTSPSMKGRFPSGAAVTLNGQQALVYSRIRHLDSDMERAARQRKVITALLAKARSASPGQIKNAMEQNLSLVVTNMSNWEISSMVASALSSGWLNYPIRQLNTPTVETEDATGFSTYLRTRFVWVVDYPRAAHDLQMELYGVSNIQLSGAGRDDYLHRLFQEANQKYGRGTSSGSSGGTKTQPGQSAASTALQQTLPPETTPAPTESPWWVWPRPTEPPSEAVTESPSAEATVTDPATTQNPGGTTIPGA